MSKKIDEGLMKLSKEELAVKVTEGREIWRKNQAEIAQLREAVKVMSKVVGIHIEAMQKLNAVAAALEEEK